ncbi:MAG: ATP-binding cassette domain-containing protein, partial [Epulopiscium sp.]|nr:ATP-binding cassette domain-containing protein [Candidatus Epulonipiscium sp.]
MKKEKILTIKDLSISFETSAGMMNAIRGVNLDLYRGETLAIVGESGSGKSVTMKAAMGILSGNGKVNNGNIDFTYYRDKKKVQVDILKLSKKEMRQRINGKRIAMIFQDPMT